MEKIKTILDRTPLNSEYISSKQDFGKVMDGVQQLKPPVYKSGWFYGAVGLATVAVIITATSMSSSPNDEPQLATTNAATSSHIEKAQDDSETNILAQVKQSNPETPSGAAPEITPSEPVPTPIPNDGPEVARVVPPIVDTVETIEPPVVTSPNIAGFANEPIPFKDLCDPMGIQVNDDIVIVGYTIQYSSCTREVTAQIRGSKIPSQLCDEISGCGQRIEIHFSQIKGYAKSTGKPVPLEEFTLVPRFKVLRFYVR